MCPFSSRFLPSFVKATSFTRPPKFLVTLLLVSLKCSVTVMFLDEPVSLESEDEEDRLTESQDDSETTSETKHCSLSTEKKTRSKDELEAMYHQFFQEINSCKVRMFEKLK